MQGGGGRGEGEESVVLCNFDEFFLCWVVLVHLFFFFFFLILVVGHEFALLRCDSSAI